MTIEEEVGIRARLISLSLWEADCGLDHESGVSVPRAIASGSRASILEWFLPVPLQHTLLPGPTGFRPKSISCFRHEPMDSARLTNTGFHALNESRLPRGASASAEGVFV